MMRKISFLAQTILCICLFPVSTEAGTPADSWRYLGEPRPGCTPRRFAPGTVSTDRRELNGVFTKDGREFWFTADMSTE